MINICALGEGESKQGGPSLFVIEYVPAKATVGFVGIGTSPTPFVIDIPAREPYLDDKVPWTYEGGPGNLEQQFSVLGVTHSGRVYENSVATDKGKAPPVEIEAIPGIPPTPPKKVTEEEAETFMKIIKASEYKIVEQMAKSPTHISLLALLLSSEPHREALLRETVSSNFSNTISFSDDEFPSEGCSHSRALHIVCKCNNYVIGRVMINNGSALNVCPVTTLKQMNVDLNRVRPSKTAVRAFDGSQREVNGEIDLLIDVGPCSFSVTFQVLHIPNAFSLLLGRPWIHSAGAVLSSLHQKLKFIIEEKLTTTISVIRDYGKVGPTHADRMIGKILMRHNHILGTGLGVYGQGISRPIEVNRGLLVPPLSHFFPRPPHIVGDTLDGPSSDSADAPDTLPTVYAVTEEIPSGVHICPAQENDELNNWTSVPRYSAVITDNPNLRHVESNTFEECLGEPRPIYFGEGLDEDIQVPEIEESLRRLEDRWLTSVEPTEEINVGTEDEPRTLKIRTGLDPTQRARMIDFLTRYQEVFAWSYTDMPSVDPSIVKHFLLLDTEKFPPKRQQLRQQRAGLLLRIKEEVVKQINAGFLEVCNYSEWVKAIRELPPPLSVREVRGFLGRLNYIAQFIANLKDKCQPLFRLLRKNAMIEWDEECQKAFNTIKAYLVQPPVLVPPTPGRPLILYLTVAAKIDFPCTNNVAEYEACILGLQAAIDFKVKGLEVFGDSMLTIFQTLGQWKTKDAKLVPYHKYLERLTENFEDISFTYTPRMKNQFADALATLASMTLKRLAIHYFLSSEILYRRSFDSTLLRCIDEQESRRLMEEMHGGNCGSHMNGLMLAKKIMRLGYYWSTMETDCGKHVKHCHRCQGMDVIGPINLKASNGHLFILVAIDYFTKWIEAVTLASVTARAVACFLKHDIIARYGVPATIVMDNAKNLNNKVIDELCAQLKIQHRDSTPYRPQMNDAVKAANKNIKKIIEKMTVNYKGWHEMLPYALLAYRTSIRTSTGKVLVQIRWTLCC
ncbi:hypothetical protein CRG98_003750 [Punica granatum]|uniref:Integrase catalytic domain-containing protein n=1 Tax=Punica granatum TaxID=22663 RepID=A0A2I0L553_PUNGR|nr:hypothetical protein CRG98_003750 [Punica granatum]